MSESEACGSRTPLASTFPTQFGDEEILTTRPSQLYNSIQSLPLDPANIRDTVSRFEPPFTTTSGPETSQQFSRPISRLQEGSFSADSHVGFPTFAFSYSAGYPSSSAPQEEQYLARPSRHPSRIFHHPLGRAASAEGVPYPHQPLPQYSTPRLEGLVHSAPSYSTSFPLSDPLRASKRLQFPVSSGAASASEASEPYERARLYLSTPPLPASSSTLDAGPSGMRFDRNEARTPTGML